MNISRIKKIKVFLGNESECPMTDPTTVMVLTAKNLEVRKIHQMSLEVFGRFNDVHGYKNSYIFSLMKK